MTDRCENCIHVQMCKWTDEMIANHTCDWYEEERPHGEWIQQYKNDGKWHDMGYFDHMYKCSKCGSDGSQRWHFCPNCGSDNRPRKRGCSFADEECKKNPCKDCGVKEGDEK